MILRANRVSLRPKPNSLEKGGAGVRPEPVIKDVSVLNQKKGFQLTPDIVRNYSSKVTQFTMMSRRESREVSGSHNRRRHGGSLSDGRSLGLAVA